MPTRILVLIKGLGIGGAERLISEGSRFWDRERFHYEVAYVLPWKDQLVPDLESTGTVVHQIGGDRGMDARTPGRLRRLTTDREVDIVHAHLPSTGILARVASPVPVVYTEHNLVHSYRAATRIASRLTYRRNAAIIAVSDAVAASIAGWPGPEPRVITNGVACSVEPEDAAAARAELDLPDGCVLIVHVGNVRPGKGHDNLIDAATHLAARRDDAVIVSIGVEKHDGDLARLRARAADVGVERHIRFLGRRPDALHFVAACDIFVNPSEVEGLPVAVLEAMALEKPIVATAVGGVPTVIRDAETGVLVAPRDPTALAEGLESLIDDPVMARQMAKGARHLVEEEYGLEQMVRATEGVYEEVLGA